MAIQLDESPDYFELTVRDSAGLVSFAVIDNETNLAITVGQIDGKKTTVVLDWKTHVEMFGNIGRVAERLMANKRGIQR